MKQIKILAFFFLIIGDIKSQNLVPNSSFENTIQCPPDQGFIYKAPPWFQPCIRYGNTSTSSSTDLYDTCSNGSTVGIPLNAVGYQPARSGHGYSGIFCNAYSTNYREYIEVPLLATMITNNNYCVQFYISLADTSEFAVSNMGAYFSVDSLLDSTPGSNAIEYVTPQVENSITNVLNDKNNWMLVSGSFIANGGEKFITIGNFHTDANSNLQNVSGGSQTFSYYYIDDISVVDCTGDGVNEVADGNGINIYPNPSNGLFTINAQGNKITELKVTNTLGQVLKTVSNTSTIDLSDVAKGIYFVEVRLEEGVRNRKIIKE